MEKHRCKICHKKFANGKTLGGHMRSHTVVASMDEESEYHLLSSEEIDSVSSDEGEKGSLFLRRNFKKARGGGGGRAAESHSDQFCSAVVQDRESESSSSRNPIPRRTWNNRPQESASSICDTISDEEVAHCLMMLSMDTWHREETPEKVDEQEEEAEQETSEEEAEEKQGRKKRKFFYHGDFDEVKVGKSTRNGRGKYRCETCNKVFRSYQALGGHRASHKRMLKLHGAYSAEELQSGNNAAMVVAEEKIHQCPVCLRIFASGQALGGHKRSHATGVSSSAAVQIHGTVTAPALAPPKRPFSRFGKSLIDLNLPAPVDDDDEEEEEDDDDDDDDDASQIEFSAVSDED